MSVARMQTQAESGEGAEGSADEPGPSRRGPIQRTGRSAGPVVDVVDPGSLLRAGERAWVEARLIESLEHMGAQGDVRVRLTDDAGIARAHAERCGVEGVTDVITFDLSEDGEALDVDLLVCADEARRQSAERGWPVEREVLLYALHGVLHCLGHDDTDEDASRRMHAREDEILCAIGVGRTFGEFGGGAGSRKI